MNLDQLAALAGTVGGLLSVGAFLPQAYRILQRRSAADVSLSMYVAILGACVLWMFYAHVHGATALFWTNAIIAVIAVFIAVLRIRYARRSERPF
jgi:uncharacterized protein with PQ loop repeat